MLAVDRAAPPGELHHRQRKHALAVAGIGGALVPFDGFCIVTLDAERAGIKLADHRHCLGVVGKLCTRQRQIERCLVQPALIGAVDQVGIGILEGRRRRGRGRCRRP